MKERRMIEFETVCVVGLGYIGLPTASILATRGFNVLGVDVNDSIVATINSGGIHIHEPGLDALVKAAVSSGRLRAINAPQPAEVFVIAVPTPFKDDHIPDMSFVENAAKAIAPLLQPGNLVILESTSPVGSTEQVARLIKHERPDLNIPTAVSRGRAAVNAGKEKQVYFAHCPERVLPGHVLKELVDNDRIIGGIDPASARRAETLYRKFVSGSLLLTDCRTAEMAKLSENASRDVNIAFANELSLICDKLDINVWETIRLANHHPRVKILQPGPGVGGHCIAVDPWFIVSSAPELAPLIRTARQVNNRKPQFVIDKIKTHAARFKSPVIACLGLAFKADIDDLRESPALEIVVALARENTGKIIAVEPYVTALPPELGGFSNVTLADVSDAVQAADIVVLLVNHSEFIDVDRHLLREKVVIDTRGIWSV